MTDPTVDHLDLDEVAPADLSAFLLTDDVGEVHHSDVRLNGKLVRFYFREASRTEALAFAKLADDGTQKSLAEFDRQVLATLCVEPTSVSAADVKRWQARKGSQAALGKLVQDVIELSGIMVNGKEETDRFPE